MMKKSYIWTLPTRVFHWLFVLGIILAFILAEEDRWLDYHAVIGYAVFILLIFRVIWGFMGPKYSLFKDFPRGKTKVKEFFYNIFQKQEKYVGHNPIASYVMLSMLIICFIIIVTGALAYGVQEGKGIFSFLNSTFFKEMELFEESHEIFSTLFIILIVFHMIGIATEKFLHNENETINSILTGYKKTKTEEILTLTIVQKVFAFMMLILFVGFFIFTFNNPKNILISSSFTPINYEKQNELFVSECASCHTLYPPIDFA